MTPPDAPLPETLRNLAAALPASPAVQRIGHGGKVYWIKQPEQRNLRWRLQKGDPARSFAREIAAWRLLDGRGLPLAPLILAEDGLLITADAGTPLHRVLRQADLAPQTARVALSAAVRALATLHQAGFAHGRPNLKDFLWDGQQAVLVDFERFRPDIAPARAQRQDVTLFVFSCLATPGIPPTAIETAIRAYADAGGAVTVTAARRCLARLTPLRPLARAIGWLTSSREWQAVPRLLDWAKSGTMAGRGTARAKGT